MNELKIFNPNRFDDRRGFFSEIWSKKNYFHKGIETDFVQDNISFSKNIYTLRGLHLQIPPFDQAKLIRCSKGKILDVAIDVRVNSPKYGLAVSVELSYDNGRQIFIPSGFLHGFLTLEDNTEVTYKCSNYYSKDHEITVNFDDKDIKIDWPGNKNNFVISDKDLNGIKIEDFNNPFKL